MTEYGTRWEKPLSIYLSVKELVIHNSAPTNYASNTMEFVDPTINGVSLQGIQARLFSLMELSNIKIYHYSSYILHISHVNSG